MKKLLESDIETAKEYGLFPLKDAIGRAEYALLEKNREEALKAILEAEVFLDSLHQIIFYS